ncbi:MAG: hypothetical protein RLZ98_1792 [Pseudomonadota bacterium]|jgi:hypothetical protein
MSGQTRVLTLGLGMMMVLSQSHGIRPFNNSLDVLCWLGYILVIALILMWPRTGKDERVKKAEPKWASAIDFETVGKDGRA